MRQISLDRPPNFTVRNKKAWAQNPEILQNIGVWRALGSSLLRDQTIDLLDKAGENLKLSIREQDRLSTVIGRLTDLWCSWRQDEREYFYYTFLDIEKQPIITRPDISTPSDIETPAEMEKMRLKGWSMHLYQRRAVRFALDHKRSLLALEMGLGKTLIALIAFHHLQNRRNVRSCIITAPKSAHNSWKEHLELSDSNIVLLSGCPPAKREEVYTRLYYNQIDGVILTPQTFSTDYKYLKKIVKRQKCLLIADEVHKFKGQGKTATAFEDISKTSEWVIGLTGTPKPNRVEDFYNVVTRISPDALGSYQHFVKRYTYHKFDQYISSFGMQYQAGALRADRLNELYCRLRNTLFVRSATDADCQLNLPPRKDLAPLIPPDQDQKNLIRRMIELQAAKEINASIYRESLEGQHGLIAQVAAQGATATAQSLGIRIEQATITPAIWSEEFDREYPNYESPKLRWIADCCLQFLNENPKQAAVVFCEYIGGLTAFYSAMVRRGINRHHIAIYSGETSAVKRKQLERQLNNGELKILIGQTAALETGANLQKRASFVAHLSTPWSPDRLSQSTARVYRQGQTRPVTVLRPSGSRLEEAKNKALTRKIMQSAGLTGILYDADRAVLTTSADERIRKAQARLLETGSYNYGIIKALCGD